MSDPMSPNGLGGADEGNGDGRLWLGGSCACGAGGRKLVDFVPEMTSEMEGSDCLWAPSESSEALRESTGEIMPGMAVGGAE